MPRELIWVVDTSGSMEGAPLDLAVRAMRRAVEGMDADDSFTILRFSNGVSGLSRHPLPATPVNRRRAERFLDHLVSDGGTMMEPAVRAALDLPEDPDRNRVVCLLTDGLIGNEDQVLTEVAAHPGVTFAAVGIGSAPNRYLLGELGRLGGGVTTYTTLDEDPEAALDRLVAAMDRPVLTDVTLDWGDVPVDSVYPSRIPDLHRQKLAGELADEEPAITEVGLSAHILTDYTSFVAVERQLPAEAPAAEPVAGDGATLSKDFLARIPTGRSYSSTISSVDGVVGTFSMNCVRGTRSRPGPPRTCSRTRAPPSSRAPRPVAPLHGHRARLGLTLEQTVPLRMGRLQVSVGGVWAARDLDAAVLPVAVLATLPSAPSLEGQPPLQVWGELRWER